jgi:hypothetical protein
MTIAEDYNCARFRPGFRGGHYESYYLRANHPVRPLAFWIRYTVFSPKGRPEEAIGELWAAYFNGETGRNFAAKSEVPVDRCSFSMHTLAAKIADSELTGEALSGGAGQGPDCISWDLGYRGGMPPLFALPAGRYEGGFPKAKTLVGMPLARFDGVLRVAGETVRIEDWTGSQNHNWGSRHTDTYAYGQVAGFDNAPGSFLEVASARLKMGPLWTPLLTPLVLRHEGREYTFNTVLQALRARAAYGYFSWRFKSRGGPVEIEGEIAAPASAFVGFRYYNPPGGLKYCINSKIASCTLRLTDRRDSKTETLHTRNRAAFEILGGEPAPGVDFLA